MLPWQSRFLRGALAPSVTTSALSVGRGNGKSTFTAAIAAAALWGPLARPRGEVIVVASSYQQSRIIFEHVLGFIDGGPGRDGLRIIDSTGQAAITHLSTGARVRCIASDPRRAHGIAPSLVLADEPAQWEPSKADRMLAALETSIGKIPSARIIALGTRPADEDHWFSRWLDGGADYAQVHTAGPDDPPYRIRTWRKANPSIDYMPMLRKALEREREGAKRDVGVLASFRALRLNQGVPDVVEHVLIDAKVWSEAEDTDATQVGRPVVGIDLGTTASMSAAAAYWPDSGSLDAFAVWPESPSLAERGIADGVGDLYVRMHHRGELLIGGGRVSDIRLLLDEALERWGRPAVYVCDRWREGELRQALDAGAHVAGIPIVIRGMGYRDGGEDVRLFRRAILDAKVRPVRSLLMRSAVGGARVTTDPAGNSKLAKRAVGRRQVHRDDAAAAAILAVAEGVRKSARPRPRLRVLAV